MKKYQLRLNSTSVLTKESTEIRGKVAFKTVETDWLHTNLPSIALISINSDFHNGINGDLKIHAFISTLRENIKEPVSILLADIAHFHTQKLKYQTRTSEEILLSTNLLRQRYRSYFDGCNLLYWSTAIHQNKDFSKLLSQVHELLRNDKTLQKLLHEDAISTYTEKRKIEFPNKKLYIKHAKTDILEQTACILVLSKLGYRYQFYPGAPFASAQYVNQRLLPPQKQVNWINVFLSIEKKSSFPIEDALLQETVP